MPAPVSRPRRSPPPASNDAYLPGVELPESVHVVRAAELELGDHDLVCLTVPARALPSVLAAHGERIPAAAPACWCCPRASCRRSGRCRRRSSPSAAPPARSRCSADRPTLPRCSSTARRWCSPRSTAGLQRQLADVLGAAGLDVSKTQRRDRRRAGRRREERRRAGRGRRLGRRPERGRRRRRQGVRRGRRAGAGPRRAARDVRGPRRRRRPGRDGRLVEHSRNRRAGELLAQGVPASEIGHALGQAVEGGRLGAAAGERGARRPPRDARRSRAWRRWSKAGSSPSSGRRR